MKYLLDTHSFIWSITDSKKLSEKITKVIENSENEVLVSVITFWEMSIKRSVGTLDMGKMSPEDFIKLAGNAQFTIVGLTPKDAATSCQLPWKKAHRDPFDRMLVWKAIKN